MRFSRLSRSRKTAFRAKLVPVPVAVFYWVREVHAILFYITFRDLTELILGIRTSYKIVHHEGPVKKTAICLRVRELYLRAKIGPLLFLPAPDNVLARSQNFAPYFRRESKHVISTNRESILCGTACAIC